MVQGSLPFNPENAYYSLRHIYSGNRKHDGSKYKPTGPYWYAYWYEGKRLHCTYLGKELPPECAEFRDRQTTKQQQTRSPSKVRVPHPPFHPPPDATVNYYDTIRTALDKGNQVVIDVASIAQKCAAYMDHIEKTRYVLYRDPRP